jgi:aromatic-L-amino-acid/L-tryptophan decarboxylase
MTPEEFRAAGHQLVDWIADFRSGIESYPVRAQVKPGEIRAGFAMNPPSVAGELGALLGDLDQLVMPGMTHTQHPRFFGFFPSNATLSSLLGDMASTGLGALGITWQSNPALTEVEEVMCDWMRQLVGLSEAWFGTIHDTASTACLVALLSARERVTGNGGRSGGLQAEPNPLVVYASEQAHSSVAKAARLAGFGADNVRRVAVDPANYAMLPDALAAAIIEDLDAGRRPCAVVASVGTTGTTALDPVARIADIAAQYGVWVHVDAALAGSAMLLPECRWMWEGVEAADSVSWNPHKWLGVALDCALYYVRDVTQLVGVMAVDASYLKSAADGDVTHYRDWGIPLGRRFRSLKLWFTLRLDGMDAIQARLRRDMANAQWFAEQVIAADGWEVIAPVPLQTVCVRHRPQGIIRSDDELDAHTLRWVETINASGYAYLTPAVLNGQWVARVSIGAETTTRADVENLWKWMQKTVEALSTIDTPLSK